MESVEDKKYDRVELKKSYDTERRNLALDKTMDVQVGVVYICIGDGEMRCTCLYQRRLATRHHLCDIPKVSAYVTI